MSIKKSYKRSTCRLCGSKDLSLAFPINSTPIADNYFKERVDKLKQDYFSLDLYLCNNCSHIQLIEVIDPSILFSNYVYKSSVSLGLVKHFECYVSEVIEKFKPKVDSLIIDIGSNDGSFLKFFKNRGFKVLGIDPAKNIAKEATKEGIKTIPNFFDQKLSKLLKKEYGKAEIITANNVFAHSDNLDQILKGINNLLEKNGIFIFEVSYMVDIVERFLFDTVYHEHLCYHTIIPLDKFFEKNKMELFDIKKIGTKGGSIRCFVQHKGGDKQISNIVSSLIEKEKNERYNLISRYKNFSIKVNEKKNQTLKFIKSLKQKGSNIAGYGASATVTTLLHHFEIGDFLECLFDDNPDKHHTFSPGYNLRVLPSDQIYQKSPDYIIILAWNYSEPIMNKHQKFMDNGGRFILPLMDFKVI